jgi:hypothetical protein
VPRGPSAGDSAPGPARKTASPPAAGFPLPVSSLVARDKDLPWIPSQRIPFVPS